MRIEEALRMARYARKPISVRPDRDGRPFVEYWLAVDEAGYFGGDPSGFMICYHDMIPKSRMNPSDIGRYVFGWEDWEPYPVLYVIDFRRRYTQDPLMRGGWTPIRF